MKFEQNWLRGFRGEVVLKMLTDARTDGRRTKSDHFSSGEQSSGELKMFIPVNPLFLYMTLGLPGSSVN